MRRRHVAEPAPELGPLFDFVRRGQRAQAAGDALIEKHKAAVPELEGAYFEGPNENPPDAKTKRLGRQLADVFEAIQDGGEYTLEELSRHTGHPPASISAQLRHLRKKRFGGFIIEKRHKGGGLYVYRLVVGPDGKPARAGDSRP